MEDACNQVPEELKLQKAEHGYHRDCYQGFRTLKRHIGQLLQIFVWKRNHLGSKKEIILGQRTIWLKKKSSWVKESCNLLKDTKQINAGYRTEKVKNEISKKLYLLAEIVILFPEQCKKASIFLIYFLCCTASLECVSNWLSRWTSPKMFSTRVTYVSKSFKGFK